MPRYLLQFDRPVTTWDRFYRVVEAESLEVARLVSHELASEANHSCPDDAAPSNWPPELGSWAAVKWYEATDADIAAYGEPEDD